MKGQCIYDIVCGVIVVLGVIAVASFIILK
jgi:hypothetical protein